MEQCIVSIETTIGNLTGQLNAFTNRIEQLFQKIEENDTGTKQSIQTHITGLESQITGIEQTYMSAGTALDVKLSGMTANLDARLIVTEQDAIGNAGRVSTLEAATAQATRDTVNLSNSIRDMISEIEARIGNQTAFGGTREKSSEGKPLMEYKMISDLGRLTSDKSGFRD